MHGEHVPEIAKKLARETVRPVGKPGLAVVECLRALALLSGGAQRTTLRTPLGKQILADVLKAIERGELTGDELATALLFARRGFVVGRSDFTPFVRALLCASGHLSTHQFDEVVYRLGRLTRAATARPADSMLECGPMGVEALTLVANLVVPRAGWWAVHRDEHDRAAARFFLARQDSELAGPRSLRGCAVAWVRLFAQALELHDVLLDEVKDVLDACRQALKGTREPQVRRAVGRLRVAFRTRYAEFAEQVTACRRPNSFEVTERRELLEVRHPDLGVVVVRAVGFHAEVGAEAADARHRYDLLNTRGITDAVMKEMFDRWNPSPLPVEFAAWPSELITFLFPRERRDVWRAREYARRFGARVMDDGVEFEHISSRARLLEEGREMANCVGNYAPRAALGSSYGPAERPGVSAISVEDADCGRP